MRGFRLLGGFGVLAVLVVAAPASAAIPTGTYKGKLKSGATITFKVSNKGKTAKSFKVSGKLPWKCPNKAPGNPGSGPFSLGPFLNGKSSAPVRRGKVDFLQRSRGGSSEMNVWRQTGSELHANITPRGKASGTVSLSATYTYLREDPDTPGFPPEEESYSCVTLGVKFTAAKR